MIDTLKSTTSIYIILYSGRARKEISSISYNFNTESDKNFSLGLITSLSIRVVSPVDIGGVCSSCNDECSYTHSIIYIYLLQWLNFRLFFCLDILYYYHTEQMNENSHLIITLNYT